MSWHIRLALLLAVASLAVVVPFVDTQAKQPRKGRKVALLVAVQDYSDSGLTNLKHCENDIEELAAVLKMQGYADDDVIVLTDSTAAVKKKLRYVPLADNIRKVLKGLVEDLREEDTFLVAFSGHGAHLKALKERGLHFCAKGTNLEKPETMVSLTEVYEQLEKNCRAELKLLFVDACRNDPTDGKATTDGRLESLTRPLIPDPPGGTVAFFSCSTGQKSYESDKLKHGVFFYHVIQGLKGGPKDDPIARGGRVTVPLLEDYLSRAVPVTVKKDRDDFTLKQVPERRGSLRGEGVLAMLAGAVEEKTETFIWKGETRKRVVRTLKCGATTMEFVKVPKGSFLMGSNEVEASKFEKPQHKVTFTKDLWVSKYPVTKSQFEAFVKATGYKTECERNGKGGWAAGFDEAGKHSSSATPSPRFSWRNPGWDPADDTAVVNVSWNDAVEYCDWVKKSAIVSARLLTEAEYEYATRGGTTTRFFNGDKVEEAYGTGGYSSQHKSKMNRVGKYKPNGYGLYDMAGEIECWCEDKAVPDSYTKADAVNPVCQDPNAKNRITRGGWRMPTSAARPFSLGDDMKLNWAGSPPDSCMYYLGFRICMTSD